MVAARFAAEILPGIFRLDDPCVRLRLAPEGRQALEQIVSGLPRDVFRADDSLGWVYQFWQSEKKDEVNNSERKIGGADLGPVTQLFTENYMVRFLLENSLGAWWAGRHPESALVKGFEFLRFDDEGRPAAGAFEGWPERVAEVTVMDPCCGSGHFLVEAFGMLWRMRAEEEGLDHVEAQDAVLRDNLFGLELDARCVQIAMFAVALAAWKADSGWRELPVPNIACSGISAKAPFREWTALAKRDDQLERALVRLHTLFRDADTLGSLIGPRRATEFVDPTGQQRSFEDVDFEEIAPLLEKAAKTEADDPATAVLGADATGIARAASLLARTYTLVMTNVPYLGVQKMVERHAEYLSALYPESANDLATVFLERCLKLTRNGSAAVVAPLGWLYLQYFSRLRTTLLAQVAWNVLAPLGKSAFGAISGHVVQSALLVLSPQRPHGFVAAIDATHAKSAEGKAMALRDDPVLHRLQSEMRKSPGTILALELVSSRSLGDYVRSWQGLVTGDVVQFTIRFWEVSSAGSTWERFLVAPGSTSPYAGRTTYLRWENGAGKLKDFPGAHNFNPQAALGQQGVLVAQMGELYATLYRGEMFNDKSVPLVLSDPSHLDALWAYCSSAEFRKDVRRINQSMSVGNGYFLKVPIDIEKWRKTAAEVYPYGLPEPWSDDPAQWLFEGRPEGSTDPLQVGVARLVGYRWPEQAESDDLDEVADVDGIVSLPPVASEAPAAERLQRLLARAFGTDWGPGKLKALLEQSGSNKKDLADWLRDDFFKLHCRLFHNRPFVWHVWDGRKDGFSALVNYHRLNRPMLEKLTYSYLGQDWIERQKAGVREDVAGAEARLAAAQALRAKLEAILDGEPPYDIYVRWKDLHEQPLGWEPDLNDGVRLNVRPFVEAGVLRSRFNVHWKNDRGKDPDGRERRNDLNVTRAEKLKARRGTGPS